MTTAYEMPKRGDATRRLIYDFIVGYITDNGYPPSTREICSGVYLSSTSTVNGHLRVPGMKFVKEENDGKRNNRNF